MGVKITNGRDQSPREPFLHAILNYQLSSHENIEISHTPFAVNRNIIEKSLAAD